MVAVLLVGAGGFIGSAARYAAGGMVHRFTGFTFPWGTVAVNIFGCFLIGLIAALSESRQMLTPEIRLLVMVGVLGGFTTFSTFGFETFQLLRDGELLRAIFYAGIQLLAGLIMVWIGYTIAR
jgi:CrcB protein